MRTTFKLPITALVGCMILLVQAAWSHAAAQVVPYQQVGRQQDGTVVSTTNQVLTPAGGIFVYVRKPVVEL